MVDGDNWNGKLQYQETMVKNKFKVMQSKIQNTSTHQTQVFREQVRGLEKRFDRVKKSQAQIKDSLKTQQVENKEAMTAM